MIGAPTQVFVHRVAGRRRRRPRVPRPGVRLRRCRSMPSRRGETRRGAVEREVTCVVSVVSVGGYLAFVSGRTTCAPCKAEWPSVASMLTSVAHRLLATVRPLTGCLRADMCLHACGQLQYGLANQGLIFSLVLLYYFTLGSYVHNYARWQGRTPPA